MPNKKNNSNKPNGFMMYADEIKNQLLREGFAIRSKPDLIAAASPRWQDLPEDERQYYKDKAKWEWENRNITGNYQKKSSHHANRRDNLGQPLSDRVDIVQITENKRKRERQDVFQTFPAGRDVLHKKFYFIDFISLLDEPTEDGWPSLEVAAIEFSLQGGIERCWHKFMNPEKIPQGYRFKAQQKSELQHLIPVTGLAQLNDTATSIYDGLFYFLSRGTQIIPPIYCKMSDTERIDGCIRYLSEKAGRPNQLKRLYELESLILDLDAHLQGTPINFAASKSVGTELISSTIFDYESGTRCVYHEDQETKYCALGTVNRYCYCISNYFCKNYDIPITECHLPMKKNEQCYTLIQSTSVNKQRSKKRPESERASDILHLVKEKLKVEADSQVQQEEDEIREAIEKEEQKKRWLSLRGGTPSETVVESSAETVNYNGAELMNKNSSDSKSDVNFDTSSIGSGRGRGRGRSRALIANLRRPGEQPLTESSRSPPPGFTNNFGNSRVAPPPGFEMLGRGRGAALNNNLANLDKKWAGGAPSPAAFDAPLPPSAWIS